MQKEIDDNFVHSEMALYFGDNQLRQFDNFVRYKIFENKDGRAEYLIHTKTGISTINTYTSKNGATNQIDSTNAISPYYLDHITLREDPYNHQIRYIANFKYKSIVKRVSSWSLPELQKLIGEHIPSTNKLRFKQYIGIILNELLSQNGNRSVKHEILETNYGFSVNGNNIIFLNNCDEPGHVLDGQYDIEMVRKCLDFIDYAAGNIDNPTHFATAMKYIFAAPLQWCKIVLGYKKQHLLLRGDVDSGKTFYAEFSQYVYAAPPHFAGSAASANTEARLAGLFDESTFIKVAEEANDMWKEKADSNLYQMIKSSDKNKVIRTYKMPDQTKVSQYNRSSILFTQNPFLSLSKSLSKRINVIVFDDKEYAPRKDTRDDFEERFREIKYNLSELGNYLAAHAPDILTIKDLKMSIIQVGEKLIHEIYKLANKKKPFWLENNPVLYMEYESDAFVYDGESEVKNMIRAIVRDCMRGHYNSHNPSDHKYDYLEMLEVIYNKKLFPSYIQITSKRLNQQNVIFTNDFVDIINKKSKLEVSGLKSLTTFIPGSSYTTHARSRVVKMDLAVLCSWLEYDGETVQSNIVEELENEEK